MDEEGTREIKIDSPHRGWEKQRQTSPGSANLKAPTSCSTTSKHSETSHHIPEASKPRYQPKLQMAHA